jgi:hypothetical protein
MVATSQKSRSRKGLLLAAIDPSPNVVALPFYNGG